MEEVNFKEILGLFQDLSVLPVDGKNKIFINGKRAILTKEETRKLAYLLSLGVTQLVQAGMED